MTSLVAKLVPTTCGRSSNPCCHHHRTHPTAAGTNHPGPQLLRRHRVHGPHLHALGLAAGQGTWLRLGGDRLARLDQWAKAGAFDRLHLEVLDRLGLAGRLDWSRASVDSASMRAKRGGPRERKSRRSWQARVQASPSQ